MFAVWFQSMMFVVVLGLRVCVCALMFVAGVMLHRVREALMLMVYIVMC